MKVRLILIVIALLVVFGLLSGTGSVANPKPQQDKQRLTISSQGRLLELFDADNISPPKKVGGDGFKLSYETQGKMRSASLRGPVTKGLRASSKPAQLKENKATAIAQTTDRSIEIASSFAFNSSTGELFIKRNFRNISKYPVTLHKVWNYIDPNLMVKGQANQTADLLSVSQGQINAGLSIDPEDCMVGECPVPPPCPVCPDPGPLPGPNPFSKYLRACLYSFKTKVLLQWAEPITLKPQLTQQPGGEAFIVIRVLIK